MVIKRRRRSAKWNWAGATTLVISDTSNVPQSLMSDVIFPPARTDWLLQNGRGANHITVKKILLWMHFYIVNPSTSLVINASNVDFSVQRITQDSTGAQSPSVSFPFANPVLPSALTSWTAAAAEETDGLDPYLWSHREYTSYGAGGAVVSVTGGSGGAMGNAGNFLNDNSMGWNPNYKVLQSWQPSVVIRSSRRLTKGQGLGLCMSVLSGLNNNLTYNLLYACRVLTS